MRLSSSYITTIDPNSAVDMEKLEIIKQAVSIANQGRDKKKYVKLHGRGARRSIAKQLGLSKYRFDQELPLRFAQRMDVYIYDKR
jgi:hypothetical protein